MKKFSSLALFAVLIIALSVPLLVFAQSSCAPGYTGVDCSIKIPGGGGSSGSSAGGVNTTYLDFYYYLILTTVNSYFVPTLIAIAFIVFLYGVYKYFIQGAAEEKSRVEGRQWVLWGITGLVVILSVWGLVNLVKDTIVPSSAQNTHPTYPTL